MLRPYLYRSLRQGMACCGAMAAVLQTYPHCMPLQLCMRAQSNTPPPTATQPQTNTAHSRPPSSPSSSPFAGGRGGSYRGRGRGRGSGTRVHRGPLKDRYPPLATDLSDPRRRLVLLIDGTNPQLLPVGCRSIADVMQRSALYANVLPAVLRVGVPVLLRVFAPQLSAEWQLLCAGGAGEEGADTGTRHGLPLPASHTRAADHTVSSSSCNSKDNEGSTSESAAATREESEEHAADKPDTSVQVEFFRVERFIPVPMQIEADAQHIYDYRAENKVEGVCYVCAETDRAVYERILQQQYEAALPGTSSGGGGEHAASAPAAATTSSSSRTTTTSTAAFFNQYMLDELGMVKEMTVDGRAGDRA